MNELQTITEIAEFKPFEANLAEFKKRYDVVYDMEDPAQNKAARSDRMTVAKVIIALDEKHKELKAPLKAQVDLIDSTRKRIKDELETLRSSLQLQATDWDNKKKAEAKVIQDKIDSLRVPDLGISPSSETIRNKVIEFEGITIDDSYGDEVQQSQATSTYAETLLILREALEGSERKEAEAKELEALRREKDERDARDRADAEARAKKDREEEIRVEATEKAQEDERRRVETERVAQVERDRKAQEAEAKKKANKAHRTKIEKQAIDSLIDSGINDAEASGIVGLIVLGKVTNITINY